MDPKLADCGATSEGLSSDSHATPMRLPSLGLEERERESDGGWLKNNPIRH